MEFFYFRVEEFFVYGGDEMAENWYSTMHGVQQKLDELKSTNLIAPNLSLSSVLQTRTAELRVLREVVLKSELDFYNSFDRLKGLPPR
jgi:hypothetical protein